MEDMLLVGFNHNAILCNMKNDCLPPTQSNDEIGPDNRLHRLLQQLQVLLAEFAGHHHVLGEGQASRGSQVRVGVLDLYSSTED